MDIFGRPLLSPPQNVWVVFSFSTAIMNCAGMKTENEIHFIHIDLIQPYSSQFINVIVHLYFVFFYIQPIIIYKWHEFYSFLMSCFMTPVHQYRMLLNHWEKASCSPSQSESFQCFTIKCIYCMLFRRYSLKKKKVLFFPTYFASWVLSWMDVEF